MATVRKLRGALLRSVSRSFYLSIRLLPAKLRDPIAIAYLLARATDTIADTAQLDAALRMRHLDLLARLIQGEEDKTSTAGLISEFAPLQADPSERALIEQLPACLRWLDAIEERDRADIRRVLATINHGQRLDVDRFGDSSRVTALADAVQLEEYTYLVAGCVGDFWTRICFRHVPRFAFLPAEEMISLGVEYGKGLQLINIVRDLGADLRSGRCYLPADELHSLGATAASLQQRPALADPAASHWRERAAMLLESGVRYSCAIRPWRVRLATVLPALIGARTLTHVTEAGPGALERKVKISRTEVRQIIFRLVRGLASPATIRRLFSELSSHQSYKK